MIALTLYFISLFFALSSCQCSNGNIQICSETVIDCVGRNSICDCYGKYITCLRDCVSASDLNSYIQVCQSSGCTYNQCNPPSETKLSTAAKIMVSCFVVVSIILIVGTIFGLVHANIQNKKQRSQNPIVG